jgi:pyruvate,water dikinase
MIDNRIKSAEMPIISSNSIESENLTIEILGGKGLNLMHLVKQNFRVPEFIILPANWLFDEFQKERELFLSEDEIFRYLGDAQWFSVRSSAIQEDGNQYSFAGQFKTELFVNRAELNASIERVWHSLKSPQIETYCREHGLARPDRMAIVVQIMIDSEVSGVAFGVNPVSGRRDEFVISSLYGLGEGLVGGELDADTFIVHGDQIEAKISPKKKKLVRKVPANPTAMTEFVDVEPQNRIAASLSNEQIFEISKVLEKLKFHFKKPQDIEFAYFKNQFYLLQTRPVTALNCIADPSGEMILWDNSNIIESYPGVTTPLTFSFIIKMYESVYIQLCRLLGVSEPDLIENRTIFENMLGLINGRVYYNLLSWYKALALLPGYQLNAEFMEKMMGVKERFELKNIPQRTKWTERLRVLVMIRSMWKNLRELPSMRRDFQREFQIVLDEFDAIDFSKKSAWELMELYLKFEQTLLKKWKAPLVNDFYAMIYFGVLQKLVDKYELPLGIHNDLLSGADDIISTEPIKRMQEMRLAVLEIDELKKLFEDDSNTAESLWTAINKDYLGVQQFIHEYLKEFGDRSVGELKLETITYKQDPLMLVRLLQMYVRQEPVESQRVNLRDRAEEQVNQLLSKKPFKRLLFNFVLKKTRVLVSARENLRFERTRGFGKVREMFLALGDVFYGEGIILHPRDIFYLTQQEIFDYIKGTSITPELTQLIDLRKRNYQVYENQATAERIRTYGVVYHANVFDAVRQNHIHSGDLKGIGCCPGVVKARVQVVHHPSEVADLNGDILVTASTDPGWVTLFPNAGGILVERGSLLSHSAIVSRELGKPCIVGISNLLNQLKTGDWVEMDGSTGNVQIISTNE